MIRATVLLALLCGLAWWLHGEQARGRFQTVNDGFLEVLLANTRDRFVPDLSRTNDVVFLPLKEEDKSEYAAWPPQPVDYQMILKGTLSYEPTVIVLIDSLQWPNPKPPLIADVADLLLPVPAVVITTRPTDTAVDSLKQSLLPLTLSRGEPRALPNSQGHLSAPEPAILRIGDPALLSKTPADGVPMLASHNEAIHASPALLAVLRALKVPISSVRVFLGGGAGVMADAGFYLPLQESGTLSVAQNLKLNEQNALELMTAQMLDDPESTLPQKMGKGRILVLGIDSETDHSARDQASALAHALALPRVQLLSGHALWIISAIAILLGLSLLTVASPIRSSLLYLLFALVGCYLCFQLQGLWFPPVVPACLLLAAGMIARLLGKSKTTHG